MKEKTQLIFVFVFIVLSICATIYFANSYNQKVDLIEFEIGKKEYKDLSSIVEGDFLLCKIKEDKCLAFRSLDGS